MRGFFSGIRSAVQRTPAVVACRMPKGEAREETKQVSGGTVGMINLQFSI